MIDLPPPQPYLPVLFTTDSLLACMRAYGEACARAALEAHGGVWTLMSDVQVVSSDTSTLPDVFLDGWQRTVLREGDCVIALRNANK